MPKIYDAVEIGLTKPELRQALRQWLRHKTSFSEFEVTDVTMHPNGEYVVRFKVEPPMTAEDKKQIAAPDLCNSTNN